uniref:cilia- and flagella-associated protein 54-like n=1 Tax=Podarcis muralis TaxID=64176 RepID=UPI0010A09C34
MAEVALRLTSVMETIADFTIKCGTTSVPIEKNDAALVLEYCVEEVPSLIQKSPSEQLHLAYEYLDRAINAMNRARLITLLPDGTSVLDNCCKKNWNKWSAYDINEKSVIGNNFIMDLHIELIQAQHRVAVKLLNLPQGIQSGGKNIKSKATAKNLHQFKHLTEQDVTNKIKKNKLSRALYLMQKATLMPVGAVSSSPKQLLEIAWYCIFGRVAEGCNPKVRLNNYSLKNTAEVVPFDETCILEVEDLEPNQSYIFAVAAYDSDGNLISDSIGETLKPILAYPPLSAAAVRAYLIQ